MIKIILPLLFISQALLANIVYPEIKTAIAVSAIDINRVSCSHGKISSIDYTAGAGLTHKRHKDGKNAIFLFQKLDKGGVIELTSTQISVLIGCDNHYYSLIMQPKKLDSQTIFLQLSANEIQAKKNYQSIKGLSNEEIIINIIKKSRQSVNFNKDNLTNTNAIFVFKDKVKIQINQIYQKKIAGTNFNIKRYVITSKQDIVLTEVDFLSAKLDSNIAALSLDDYNINADKWTILHLITRAKL